MLNLYQKIERLVFLQNYTAPILSKESALMCVHAVLLGRENVPRTYLPAFVPKDDIQNWIWSTIASCVLSDHKAVHNWTLSSLKLLHISVKELKMASNEDRLQCLSLVEEHLDGVYGKGIVHYEMSRFSPFQPGCDIAQVLIDAESPSTVMQATLFKRLRERSFAKVQYHQKHAQLLQNLNLRGDWDIFHSVYKFKLEQLWQQSWLDSEKYQVNPNIISTIVVGESFE